MSTPPDATKEARSGVLFAASAFAFWGVIPIYFKQLGHVGPFEIIAHRVVWTVVLAGGIMLLMTRGRNFRALLRNPRRLAGLTLSGACIASNWVFFVWAVNTGRVLETSLGYFINPLLSVLLGTMLLGERLRPRQYIAVAIAAAGVLISLAVYGKLPWISLILAGSFGFYGLLRKRIQVDAVTGLFTETLILLPFAAAYSMYLIVNGTDHFLEGAGQTRWLLFGTGAVTAAPLVLFAIGARRINLSTLGILQYIAPSLSFVVAVALYNEPFGWDRLITFGFIWAALAIYTADSIHTSRRNFRAARAERATAESVSGSGPIPGRESAGI